MLIDVYFHSFAARNNAARNNGVPAFVLIYIFNFLEYNIPGLHSNSMFNFFIVKSKRGFLFSHESVLTLVMIF